MPAPLLAMLVPVGKWGGQEGLIYVVAPKMSLKSLKWDKLFAMSAAKFQPSTASLTPRRKALQDLAYIRAAVEKMEEHLTSTASEEVPTWVLTQINQGASCLGGALSFIRFQLERGKKS